MLVLCGLGWGWGCTQSSRAPGPTAHPGGAPAGDSTRAGASGNASPSGKPRAAGACPAPVTASGATGGASATVPDGRPAPAATSFDWSMFGYDLANTRDNRSETRLSVSTVGMLRPRWTTPVAQGGAGLTSTPLVVGDTVYVCEHPGVLAAYAAPSGEVRWRTPRLSPIRCGTPLVTADRIYVSVGDSLRAHNRSDGTMIWSKPYGVKLALTDGSPVMAGERIVVGVGTFEVINDPPYSAQGIIVAFEKDGTEAWRVTPAAFPADMKTTGISVWSSPAVDEELGLIFIGTGQAYQEPAGPNSDALMAIDYKTGEVRWVNQFHAGDFYTDRAPGSGKDWDIGAAPNLFTVKGVPAVGVGSKGALYRAVDRKSGATLWDRDLGNASALGGVMAAAAVAQGRIFVAHRVSGGLMGGASQLRALKVDDGTDAWDKPFELDAFTWGAVSHANGVVYVSIQNGKVFAIDAQNGAQLWTTQLANGAAGGPSVSNGWLYVPSGYTGLGKNTASADLNAFSLEPGGSPAAGNPAAGEAGSAAAPMGSTPSSASGGAAFARVMDVLRNEHGCIGGFCHGSAGGLNLQATLVEQYSALLGTDCTGAPAGDPSVGGMCAGRVRVVPGDAEASVLYQKIARKPQCGTAMPPPGATAAELTAAEIEVVRSWIERGAPFD